MPLMPIVLLEYLNIAAMEKRVHELRAEIEKGETRLPIGDLQLLVFYESISDGASRHVAFSLCSEMFSKSLIDYLQTAFEGYENLKPEGDDDGS